MTTLENNRNTHSLIAVYRFTMYTYKVTIADFGIRRFTKLKDKNRCNCSVNYQLAQILKVYGTVSEKNASEHENATLTNTVDTLGIRVFGR